MFLYKVLKNNEVTFIGTAEVMDFSKKNYVLNEKWWNEKDKEPRIKFMDYLIDLYKKKL